MSPMLSNSVAGDPFESHIRLLVIIFPESASSVFVNLVGTVEQVLCQPAVTNGLVVTFVAMLSFETT